MADLVFASKSVNVTQLMLENFHDIFGSEEEVNKLFQKHIKKGTKEFEKSIKQSLGLKYEERQSEMESDICLESSHKSETSENL